ncbi:phosphoenolpyruvate--protein phosphotransferase [Microbacterium kribbense]|uniref:Phosphoenolpyruvate-protein phosphotransferase n=1 Tax=Microbacterium kribbense TaxID=433645 RepID=A0ABP7GK02_9MICO
MTDETGQAQALPAELTGVGIGPGVAQGPVARMADPLPAPEDVASALSVDDETARAREGVAAVAGELNARAEQVGGTAAEVLEAQAMMAEDPSLQEQIDAGIAQGKTAERAVFEAFATFQETLTAMGGYLGERAADLADIAQRVIAHLRGVPAPGVPDPGHPFILVARDLAPADTALLDLTQVLALVTTAGGPTSHTAILAREKSIVAVVGAAGADRLADGQTVIVDAAAGIVTTGPTAHQLADAQQRADDRAAAASAPLAAGALADGTAVPLLANLGKPGDAAAAIALGAEGVGLFRTEFLFLSATEAPTVAEQQAAYEQLLAGFAGKKVVVRALDAGADKPLSFLGDAHEENPALGRRGLRALRANEQILRDQLTALAQADAATTARGEGAELWVMAPMVATVEETEYFTAFARECGIRVPGVMVEVPALALLADRVLAATDFASIGTNDLTQYTMAADRVLGSVASYQSPWHPAVLRLVADVGFAGRTLGKPVGICGEAAADPLLAVVLVGLGATSLSMAPAALADVRASLRAHTLDQAKSIAAAALAAGDAASARAAAVAAASPTRPA